MAFATMVRTDGSFKSKSLLSAEQILCRCRHSVRLEAELPCSSLSGADAPKVFVPMTWPDGPT